MGGALGRPARQAARAGQLAGGHESQGQLGPRRAIQSLLGSRCILLLTRRRLLWLLAVVGRRLLELRLKLLQPGAFVTLYITGGECSSMDAGCKVRRPSGGRAAHGARRSHAAKTDRQCESHRWINSTTHAAAVQGAATAHGLCSAPQTQRFSAPLARTFAAVWKLFTVLPRPLPSSGSLLGPVMEHQQQWKRPP